MLGKRSAADRNGWPSRLPARWSGNGWLTLGVLGPTMPTIADNGPPKAQASWRAGIGQKIA